MDRSWRSKQVAAEQRERLYEFIIEYHTEHTEVPTRAQMAEELDVEDSTVGRYLKVLIDEGRLERGPRGVRLPTW